MDIIPVPAPRAEYSPLARASSSEGGVDGAIGLFLSAFGAGPEMRVGADTRENAIPGRAGSLAGQAIYPRPDEFDDAGSGKRALSKPDEPAGEEGSNEGIVIVPAPMTEMAPTATMPSVARSWPSMPAGPAGDDGNGVRPAPTTGVARPPAISGISVSIPAESETKSGAVTIPSLRPEAPEPSRMPASGIPASVGADNAGGPNATALPLSGLSENPAGPTLTAGQSPWHRPFSSPVAPGDPGEPASPGPAVAPGVSLPPPAPMVDRPVVVASIAPPETMAALPAPISDNGAMPGAADEKQIASAPGRGGPERIAVGISHEKWRDIRNSVAQPGAELPKIAPRDVAALDEEPDVAVPDGAVALAAGRDGPALPGGTDPRPPAHHSPLPHGLGARLAEHVAQSPDRSVEVTLSPEELGRVRMSISTQDGSLTMLVQADRPETLDMLRRNIDQLAQDFRALGFTDLSFSFGDRPAGQPDTDGRAAAEADRVVADPPEIQLVPSGVALAMQDDGGLDLRV